MKMKKVLFISAVYAVLLCGCNSEADITENNDISVSVSLSAKENSDFISCTDYFSLSENLLNWSVAEKDIADLYKAAVSSDELMGHIIYMYDTLCDLDGNGDMEYAVATSYGFGDIADSLIIFDKKDDISIEIIYNSASDSDIIWHDFQHITGYFSVCPAESAAVPDGTLYKPELNEDIFMDGNTFRTARWSNIAIHNICYKIEYDGSECSVTKLSDKGWKVNTVYENEEPTENFIIETVDFME